MKSIGKRLTWKCATLILLPVLVSGIWYGREVRQQRLDHALIAAIKKNDTRTAIALLNLGADGNTTDKPATPITLRSLSADLWTRIKGNKPQETQQYPSALMLVYPPPTFLRQPGSGSIELVDNASPMDNPILVNALIEHGSKPDTLYWTLRTTLHEAAYHGHIGTVKVLLENHANPNVKGIYGYTPLMLAEDIGCARLLIEYGAKVSMKDETGETAIDYAKGEILGMDDHDQTYSTVFKSGIRRRKDVALVQLLEETLKREQAEEKLSTK